MAEVEGKFDGILSNLGELHHNSVPELLKTIASFLFRKTEFFSADLKGDRQWEKLLLEVFCVEATKADLVAEKKRKERVNERRKLILKKKLELERTLGELDRELTDVDDEKIKRNIDVEKKTTSPICLSLKEKTVVAGRGSNGKGKGKAANFTKTVKKVEKPTAICDKPKYPPSAYTIWLKDYGKIIRSQNPGIKTIDFRKRAVELWRAKNDEEKNECYRKAAEAKIRYVNWKMENEATYEAGRETNAPSRPEIRTKRARKSVEF